MTARSLIQKVIEADTCNIGAATVEAAITLHTPVIMLVSLYGQPASMDVIKSSAARLP